MNKMKKIVREYEWLIWPFFAYWWIIFTIYVNPQIPHCIWMVLIAHAFFVAVVVGFAFRSLINLKKSKNKTLLFLKKLYYFLLFVVSLIFIFSEIYIYSIPCGNGNIRYNNNITIMEKTNPHLESFYYSGYTFLGLGHGNAAPEGNLLRLLTLFEAFLGLVSIALFIGILANLLKD